MGKIGYILLLFLLVVLGAFSYISYGYVSKRAAFVKSYYADLSEEERNIPSHIKDIVVRIERRDLTSNKLPDSVRGYAVSQMGFKYVLPNESGNWQIRKIILNYIMKSTLTDDEIFILYCHFLPYENGIGLHNSSRYYLNKELSEATVEDIALLLAAGRSPKHFSPILNPGEARKMQVKLVEMYNR